MQDHGRQHRAEDDARRRALGAAFVPEERLGHGAVPDLPLSENVILTRHASDRDLARGGFVNSRAAAALAPYFRFFRRPRPCG